MSAAERAREASNAEQANKQTDQRVALYFSLYFWFFWPTVICSFSPSFTQFSHLFAHLPARSLIPSFACSSAHMPTYLVICPRTCSFAQSLAHLPNHSLNAHLTSCLLICPLPNRSSICPFACSFIHSVPHLPPRSLALVNRKSSSFQGASSLPHVRDYG